MAIKVGGTIVVDNSRNIANANSAVFTGNTGISVPIGTTAQRPASPPLGTIRYNSESDQLEVYKTNGWSSAGLSSGSRIFSAGFANDGSG